MIDDEHGYRRGAGLVGQLVIDDDLLHPLVLGLLKPVPECLNRVPRKLRILDHVLVKLLRQEGGALVASMAVVEPEEVAVRPFHFPHVALRLVDVQNDGDSVFVVVPDQALVRVGGICPNNTSWLVRGNTLRQLMTLRSLHPLHPKVLLSPIILLIRSRRLLAHRLATWLVTLVDYFTSEERAELSTSLFSRFHSGGLRTRFRS